MGNIISIMMVIQVITVIYIHDVSIIPSCILISIPNNKILEWSKLKAFADDKIKRIERSKLVFWKSENIVGKGENADYQHFLLFTQFF